MILLILLKVELSKANLRSRWMEK